MFGFQRVMDLIWAAGDSQARGFLIGATAGRTTLASSSGALVDWLNGDWGIFFILTALMVIPSLIILWIMRNKLKLSEK